MANNAIWSAAFTVWRMVEIMLSAHASIFRIG